MHPALTYALKKGASYAELRSIDVKRINIETQDKLVKELSSNESEMFAVRVLANGGEGIAFSTKNTYQEMIDKALIAAKNFTKSLEFSNLDQLRKKIKTHYKTDPSTISLEEKKKLLQHLDQRKEFKKIHSCRLFYTEVTKKSIFENTEGRELSWDDLVVGFVVQAFAKEGKTTENFYDVKKAHCGFEIMDNANSFVHETMKMAESLLKAKHIKGGNYPVIIDQKLGGVFAHEAVGHSCEADIVLQGSSLLKDKLQKKIATTKLTLIDDGTKEGFYGWVPIDDEGVEGQKTVLIEKGVLKNFLHSRETATRMNMLPTGNGRSEGLGAPAIPRMRCTFIEEGDSNIDEMLQEMKNGYYLKGTAGGQVNTTNGEFLFNAQYGYTISKGEKKEMIKGVSLQGSILEILPAIELIAKDLSFSQGTCGKSGQGVPVSDGAPHLLLKKIRVGGQK